MSSNGDCAPQATTTVAVAVKGGGGGGKGSWRAVRWATEHLAPKADRFVLIHIMPAITSIPTPSGSSIPIEELDGNVVEMYVKDMKLKLEDMFIPFKKLCKKMKIETLVLEGDSPASALLTYITASGIKRLVLGSCSSGCITRKLKSTSVPSIVLKHAPETCKIYVVSRDGLITNTSDSLLATAGVEHKVNDIDGAISASGFCRPNSIKTAEDSSSNYSSATHERNHQNLGNCILEIQKEKGCSSVTSTDTKQFLQKQSDVEAEVEQLRLELENTVSMYTRACEDLVHAQNKVRLLSSECLEEARQVNDALKREEVYRKIAAVEKEKHLKAMKEVEMAKTLLAKEAYERQIAELNALKESMEKQKIVDALFSNDRRYKRYSKHEIEIATDFFSKSKMIGEGAYGKVYKCNLDSTPVAVKVIRPDASEKKGEFLREIEVLCQLRHPHIVLLLGACPEIGCLVYEYVEKGNLEDHIFQKNGMQPLPWSRRFRIVFEVACGLAFLHNSKPDPIVHRDLKPGNIFLDGNYVSKIGDAGLAKVISDIVPDNVTEYRDSILAGTFFYMDPEYQRTGTVRTKSDLYAFGIITLQLLSARGPNGLLSPFEKAIANGSLADVLDKSVPDWPLPEAEELAQLALKCCSLRCRDRPDLDSEVLPILKKLTDITDAHLTGERNNSLHVPDHFFCPILKEIMEDPHIAADGFSYDLRAIRAWLERHNVSPVTKLKLQHKMLVPNHTLRSAIQDWCSHVKPSSQ
ncbi:Non-specific serine/threonine protein kinase [Bertholletia excelsa]